MCVCAKSSFVTVACIWVIVRSFCACTRIKSILLFVIPGSLFLLSVIGVINFIRVIRVVRAIAVIIFVGQFKL